MIAGNPTLSAALDAAVEEGAPPTSRKRKLNENSTMFNTSEEYYEEVEGGYKRMKPFIEAVLQRWNDRVTLSAGKTNIKTFKALNNSIPSQVDLAMADSKRLERKAHTMRSTYEVIGSGLKPVNQIMEGEVTGVDEGRRKVEVDLEVYDDADFYHQLLKEFIQSNDPDAVQGQNALRKKILLTFSHMTSIVILCITYHYEPNDVINNL